MSTDTGPAEATPGERMPTARETPADTARDQAEAERPIPDPSPEDARLARMSALRWAVTGGLRLIYRAWTRVAARLFPEDSRQEALASQIGVPLPDRLNMSWVTPQLAVGGRPKPADIGRLAATGVTRVVDTRSEHKDDEAALSAAGIELLYLPTPDTYPLTITDLRRGATWVNQQIAAGHRVLIHCEHGVGRSVLLTAAALVDQGMSAAGAIDLVQRQRWQAAPNHRQIVRLQEFEREVRGRRQ